MVESFERRITPSRAVSGPTRQAGAHYLPGSVIECSCSSRYACRPNTHSLASPGKKCATGRAISHSVNRP